MSVAGAAIRAACGNRADLAAVAYFFLVFHLCQGIKQELAEYARGASERPLWNLFEGASERPLWNLFEGGGAEVFLLFQLLGAALEAGAHLEAEHGARGRVALRRAGASADFIRSPPFLAWVALGVGWDILLVSEYFDEEGEPLASNPNREPADSCGRGLGLRTAHHLRPADTFVAGLDPAECDAQVAALRAVELQMAATGEGATKRKHVVAVDATAADALARAR